MDTSKNPTATTGTTSATEIANCERKLRSLLGDTINVAVEANKLNKSARTNERTVSALDLDDGSPGEKLFAAHLDRLNALEVRVILAIALYGKPTISPRSDVLEEYDLLGSTGVKSSPNAVRLLELLPMLPQYLKRGYDRARRRMLLKRLAVNLDKAGAVRRAWLAEETLRMNGAKARADSETEARGS